MALALFDLDETLIHGDCASLWSAYMARIGWVDADTFLRRDQELMALYSEGKLAMEAYMAFSLQPLVGRTPADVAQKVACYLDEVIAPRVYPDARHTVNAHRAAGDRLLVISASAVFLVKPIAARLGIEDVLAIDLEVIGGRYTGRTAGVLTYREGKVIRLIDWLEQQGDTLAGASFYSDSRNDLPLLERVARPFAVNPDPALLAHAQAAGWAVLDWRVGLPA
ncbi:HAD family hydrolase [Pseudomonas typographi]|uniref:HAD family hydrolase n=1 Tax=Pseudomonas typographi TaxID=2715964 RepID=A0ABR7Z1L5_9PSED|nr:HAD family hydrolase [Pseudomonas typographi]MBD1551493.1 HAD family hydrolase [Pseudomonas typographi]MBD1587521.1 HAD family hydrolase [Pseudomonas typographi]MBD1599396.1 HAD family hydrolase [Pseudomonas typographi]